MKYYLEITLLNQQILKSKAYEPIEYTNPFGSIVKESSRERALKFAEIILDRKSYTMDDLIVSTSQIAYITIKPLTSTP